MVVSIGEYQEIGSSNCSEHAQLDVYFLYDANVTTKTICRTCDILIDLRTIALTDFICFDSMPHLAATSLYIRLIEKSKPEIAGVECTTCTINHLFLS